MVDEPAGVEALRAAIEGRRVDLHDLFVLCELRHAAAALAATAAADGVMCAQHVGKEARAEHRLQQLRLVGVAVGGGARGVALVGGERAQPWQ